MSSNTAAADPTASDQSDREVVFAYGLTPPTVSEAGQAVHRVLGDSGVGIWEQLLRQAGLAGDEADDDSVRRLAEAMMAAGGATALCGRALHIRRVSYHNLSTMHTTIRGAE